MEQYIDLSKNVVQKYNGYDVTFAKGENVMVNATEMAKGFGKTPKDWLRTEQAQRMINIISDRQKCLSSDLLKVTHGDNGGTWMHEDIALVFAQWLAPEFYLWCNDRIKELAKEGVATISDDDEVIAHAINVLQKRLEAKTAQLQIAENTIEQQKDYITTMTPLAEYTKDVLQSQDTYTFTQVAKDLGFRSINVFIKWLTQNNIVFKQSGQYMPYAKYAGQNLFKTRTNKFVRKDGSIGTSMSTVLTEKGRMFLQTKLES